MTNAAEIETLKNQIAKLEANLENFKIIKWPTATNILTGGIRAERRRLGARLSYLKFGNLGGF